MTKNGCYIDLDKHSGLFNVFGRAVNFMHKNSTEAGFRKDMKHIENIYSECHEVDKQMTKILSKTNKYELFKSVDYQGKGTSIFTPETLKWTFAGIVFFFSILLGGVYTYQKTKLKADYFSLFD